MLADFSDVIAMGTAGTGHWGIAADAPFHYRGGGKLWGKRAQEAAWGTVSVVVAKYCCRNRKNC